VEKTVCYKVGEAVYATLREAQEVEIAGIIDGVNEGNIPAAIVDNANALIAILKLSGKKAKAKAVEVYDRHAYEIASKESGVPIKVLRQRTTIGGKSLNDAKSTPYTPRKRGEKEVA
jgi:hypothetical protein